jgi:hypothetical protein
MDASTYLTKTGNCCGKEIRAIRFTKYGFAGGLLWAGNSAGQLVGYNLEGGRVSNREFSGCIRNLTAGDITGDGVDYIVVVTFSRSAPWTSAQYHIISAGKEDHLAPLYSDSYSVKTDDTRVSDYPV